MRKARFTETQIVSILKEIELGLAANIVDLLPRFTLLQDRFDLVFAKFRFSHLGPFALDSTMEILVIGYDLKRRVYTLYSAN